MWRSLPGSACAKIVTNAPNHLGIRAHASRYCLASLCHRSSFDSAPALPRGNNLQPDLACAEERERLPRRGMGGVRGWFIAYDAPRVGKCSVYDANTLADSQFLLSVSVDSRNCSNSFINLTRVERIRSNPVSRFSCNWWAMIRTLLSLSFSMSLPCSRRRCSPSTMRESTARKALSMCFLDSPLGALGTRRLVSRWSDIFLANARVSCPRTRRRVDAIGSGGGSLVPLLYDLASRLSAFSATCLRAFISWLLLACVLDLETSSPS